MLCQKENVKDSKEHEWTTKKHKIFYFVVAAVAVHVPVVVVVAK